MIKEGKSMKNKKDGFVEWLKSEILLVIPIKMFRVYKPESRLIFYEMVCNHACLRPESEDVQKAFKELCGEV